MPKKALLVIDIDHSDNWKPSDIENDPVRKAIAKNIKEILAEWRARNELIVFIILLTQTDGLTGHEAQYCDADKRIPEDCLVCDKPELDRLAAFLDHRHGSALEPAFVKITTNAFSNKNLGAYLRNQGVTELTLIGCSTNCCVKDTAAGALKAGFKVALLTKATYPQSVQTEADKSWWIHDAKQWAGINPDTEAPIDVII